MALRRARRRRSRSTFDTGGPDEDRTYGIWGMVALFALLALGGLIGLIVLGGSDEETAQVVTPQTLPESDDESTTTATGPTTTAPASTPPTFADGSAAPEGVSDITVADGTTSLTFDPPPGRTDAAGELVAGLSTAIAPTTVTPGADGTALVIRVDCARSAEEFVAQVTVTEAESSVTVAAAVVAPDDGPPCSAEGSPVVVTVPLSQPLGERAISVVPAGEIPDAPG